MNTDSISYAKPTFFDWGVSKPLGNEILLATFLLYLACFVAAIWLIVRTGRRLGYPRLTLVIGIIGLMPASVEAVESIRWQVTTRHYQEEIHVPAVIVIVVSFVLVLLLSLVVEVARRTRTRRV